MLPLKYRSARKLFVLVSLVLASLWLWNRAGDLLRVSKSAAWEESHRLMLQQLEIVRERAINDDPIFGASKLRSAQERLTRTSENAPIDARINSYAYVGDLELLSGETLKAAEHLATAYDLLEQVRAHVPDEVERKALLDVAVAHLRLGEVQNCVECNTCDSCILPILKDGVHTLPKASRKTIDYLTRFLQMDSQHLTARWLLNIAYMTVGEYPEQVPPSYLIPEEAFEAGAAFPRFMNQAKEVGLNTVTLSGGVVADDFDGDGWIDIMTSDWSASGQLRCFMNEHNGKFKEETETAGLTGLFGGLNLIQADYDNDGDIDVLVLRGAWRGQSGCIPNSLLQNDGHGRFTDVTIAVGLADKNLPTQTAAWADYDNDGDVDLFIGNEGFACQLFRNDDGYFTDVAEQAGVTNEYFTKGVTWGDIDGDRYPDLYVSNYGSPQSLTQNGSSPPQQAGAAGLFDAHNGEPNRLYRNNRDGTFTDIAKEAGVTLPLLSFPTWFWDVNNDGHLDLLAASYAGKTHDVAAQFLGMEHNAEPDRLYIGDGQGGFHEVAEAYGVDRVTATMGANFGDLDNDGFDDMYMGTGAPEFESLVPNVMYHNRAGMSFENVTAAGGFGHLQKGHAIAFADLDNDGDQDVFCVLGGAYPGDTFANALFINPGFKNHWIKISLVGTTSNRRGVGARIRLDIDEENVQQSQTQGVETVTRTIYKWVNSGGSFGANPLRKEIGLGNAKRIRRLEVYWPTSNTTQVFEKVPLDRAIRISEGSTKLEFEA